LDALIAYQASSQGTTLNTIRGFRLSMQLSQSEFAERLGVSAESYRIWDSGRRDPPLVVLAKARELSDVDQVDRPLGLFELAQVLGVSVYRLREAARDGRLAVTHDNRVVFGNLVPRATRAAGETYKRQYYGKKARWTPRPSPPQDRPPIPVDYNQRLIELRSRLGLSQAQLAAAIGAAAKAVIYQWESRKRVPSSLFWRRILCLDGKTAEILNRRESRDQVIR
jgi:DNA-binding transcriptional regulator YiaG